MVSYFEALWITLGVFVISKLFWMNVYELRYYNGAGDDYLQYGKKYVKDKYMQKML